MSGNKFVQPASKAIERFLKFLSIPCFRIVSEIDYRNVGFVRECSYQRLHELAVGCDRIDMHKYNIGWSRMVKSEICSRAWKASVASITEYLLSASHLSTES